MAFQEYLSQKYQGHESFIENIIFPIFGQDNYETAWDVELLDSVELQNQAARTGIRSILRCGTINLDLTPIEVFDITVSDRLMMDKNRVGVQAVIRRVMDTYSGAFMLIHYDNDVKWDWRFTFCQLKDRQEFSDSKRYTFLLGPNQSCRTAAQNFQKLADLHEDITIKDIVSAFDVEAVSKAFFDGYKKHYERFVEYITGKRFVKEGGKFVETVTHRPHSVYYPAFGSDDKAVRDYTKLLLARIVFLHFVQKKGWLGVKKDGRWGDGDEQFMLHLYQQATEGQKADFLESVLEPLFFDALNGDRSGDKDLFDTKVLGTVRIPYLNGGLFSRDNLDDIVIRYPKDFFGEFLEFLYQYNFTIDENDPNEAQVGIDPEMLGKIFENLLEDNKDKGAFYTPKEIVQYMCQESLVAYLGTKTGLDEERLRSFVKNPDVYVDKFTEDEKYNILDAVLKVKICDPAIGSGAFPIGLLNELVRCKEAIYGDEKGRDEIKKEIIRDNIYGVDIEKGAVDIARLRFWLSLIVDEEEPLPLPNLDFKIMQGNSLLEEFEGFDLSGLMDVDNSNEEGPVRNLWGEIEDGQLSLTFKKKGSAEKLHSLIREYYSENKRTKKHTLYEEIQNLVREQIDYNIDLHISKHESILDATKDRIANNKGLIDKETKKLEAEEQAIKMYHSLKEKLGQLSIVGNSFFLWHTWFNVVFTNNGGFDILIGNPPYIKELDNKRVFETIANSNFGKKYHIGKMDYWYYFLHKSIEIAHTSSIICFITSRYWIKNQGAKKIIKAVKDELAVKRVLDIGSLKLFDNVVGHHMIALYQKEIMDQPCNYFKIAESTENILLEKFEEQRFINQNELITNNYEINLEQPLTTLSRQVLGDICDVCQGVVEASDKISSKMYKNNPNPLHHIGEGIFVLSDNEYLALNCTPKEKSAFVNYLGDGDISKYIITPNHTKHLIYSDKETRNKIAEDPYFVNIKNHLDSMACYITSSNKPYGLHRPRDKKAFTSTKIITPSMFLHPIFAFDDNQFFCGMSHNVITLKEDNNSNDTLYYLLGLLNSEFADHWFHTNAKHRGIGVDVGVSKLREFPVPMGKNKSNIILIVKKIITLANNHEPYVDEELQLNQLVYSEYNCNDK